MSVLNEFELYEPMRRWLEAYLKDKYNHSHNINVYDTHSISLDRFLRTKGIRNDAAVGLDIQIDVLGIVQDKLNNEYKLFFIEAKKNKLTLKDLGQLWIYCKLINPEQAFLFSPDGFGTLDKVLNILKREDLLDYSEEKSIKKIMVSEWNINNSSPDYMKMLPKL